MKKLISIIEPLLSIIMFLVLLFTKTSDNFVYIMIMSLIIGWIIPYIVLIVSGLSIIQNKFTKLNLVSNILSFLLCLFLLFLIIKIYEKKFLILLIEYIIIAIINIINIIYLIIYLKKHPDLELRKIKEQKKKNNGVMV